MGAILNTWGDDLSSTAGAAGGFQEPKAVVGWRGVIVNDDSVDLVDLLRAYLEKAKDESCGQCFPCRLGTDKMHAICERICEGQGRPGDIESLGTLAKFVSQSAKCDIGQTLGKPVLDILEQGAEAFEQAVADQAPVARAQYVSKVTAPCIEACPSEVNIPSYLENIRMGRWEEGLAVVREDCCMPNTIGRVCVRPCEAACRRGVLDEPLAIRDLKRFLAYDELTKGREPKIKLPEPKDAKVAVIGAGPAGISCAYYLGKLGYRTTIFEAQEGGGGMAAYGIPSYRLPRDILGYEVSLVEKMGAEIRYGVNIGEDLSLEDLTEQGFDAIFIGVGAPVSSSMRCEGEDAGYQCFMTGINFLAEAARGRKPIEGDKMLVIGGGNVAMDCVRTARRLGFSDVNILYRRTEAEMPADPVEIEEAHEEGVKFHFLLAPKRVVAENGKVTGLECLRMELGEPDASGRRRPMTVEGSEFIIETDAIIPAVGQTCVVDCVLPDENSLTRWKTLVVDETTFQSNQPHVFGGGDCVVGPDTLIGALAAGKKAARFIAQYLEEGACTPDDSNRMDKLVSDLGVGDPDEKFPFPGGTHTAEPQAMDPDERIKSFAEVVDTLTPQQAREESNRCLRCYRVFVAAL